MTDKEKIKQEIERLYNLYELANDYQRMGACSTILDFIDSLPEEPVSEDLEEAAEMFYDNCDISKSSWWNEGVLYKMSESKETFIAGAEWQKQQMMKDSVHAWVNTYESVENPYDNEVSFITNLSPSKFRNEETAQIIIVKTEQQ